jgi:hypothetical protein
LKREILVGELMRLVARFVTDGSNVTDPNFGFDPSIDQLPSFFLPESTLAAGREVPAAVLATYSASRARTTPLRCFWQRLQDIVYLWWLVEKKKKKKNEEEEQGLERRRCCCCFGERGERFSAQRWRDLQVPPVFIV